MDKKQSAIESQAKSCDEKQTSPWRWFAILQDGGVTTKFTKEIYIELSLMFATNITNIVISKENDNTCV